MSCSNYKLPLIFAFEGIDGAGKSTIIQKVDEYLQSKSYSTLIITDSQSEVVLKNIFESDKDLTIEEQALFWWNGRINNLKHIIEPSINSGTQIILYDRYFDSTAVYLNLLSYNTHMLDFNYNNGIFKYPDTIFYINCDPKVALSRMMNRAQDIKSDFYQSAQFEKLKNYHDRYESLYRSAYWQELNLEIKEVKTTGITADQAVSDIIDYIELVFDINKIKNHTNNELIEKMSDMQWKLNCKIGIDTKAKCEILDKADMFIDLSQALIDETIEAKNCISWKWWTKEAKENGRYSQFIDEPNFKIELVDMFHFILSLNHISEVSIDLNRDAIGRSRIIDSLEFRLKYHKHTDDNSLYEKLFLLLDDIIYTLYYNKYNYTPYYYRDRMYYGKPAYEFQSCMNEVTRIYLVILHLYGFTIAELYDLYCKKNAVNFKRQDTGYSAITKTEDDNNELKKDL